MNERRVTLAELGQNDALPAAWRIRSPWSQKFRGELDGCRYRPCLVTVWHGERWRLNLRPWQHLRRWARTRERCPLCADFRAYWHGQETAQHDRILLGLSRESRISVFRSSVRHLDKKHEAGSFHVAPRVAPIWTSCDCSACGERYISEATLAAHQEREHAAPAVSL